MEVGCSRYHSAKGKFDDLSAPSSPPSPPDANAPEKSQSKVEVGDLKTMKKLVHAFERRLKDNIEAHLKYPNQPYRFADSKVELHEELQKLKVLTGGPELYPDLMSLIVIPSIVGLLNHENTDIAINVVQ